ncbi:hypothetical protein E4U43_003557 [Claviceps pusilla]|uniref:Ribosomal protein S21 n=1 Tax=Claviceps pusilla TaxID=123648 RepID=A0A9P7N585_9HYPO|nr:hypothetical protein E4U43_003557 [Claviceps pusilla]
MLGRLLASPSHPITTRALSSAIPLRIPPIKRSYNSAHAQPVRSNPLVGNPPVFAEPTESNPASTSQTTPPSGSSFSPSTSDSSPDAPIPPPPPPPPPPPSASDPSVEEAPSPKPPTSFAYNATDPHPIVNIADIISDKASKYGSAYGIKNPLERPNVRTKAVVGRTVFIKDRLAPQSAPTAVVALRVLDKMCRDQKIKNKYHSQKFHERKGLKKKRLRSQRWRARFKTGFKAAVSRVIELKRQGW